MTTYERVRFDGKTVILMNPKEIKFLGHPCLSGIEVDIEGREIAPRGVDERQRIIFFDLITRRTPLVMDKMYAVLCRPEEAHQ